MCNSLPKQDIPLLRDCHCFNLRRVTLETIALYDRHLAPVGISIQQFSVLRHIDTLGPLSVTDLAERMGLDRTTLSRNLKLMERRGLLQEEPSLGRQRLLKLTPAGARTLAQARPHWQAAQEALESRLEPGQMDELERILARLLTHT